MTSIAETPKQNASDRTAEAAALSDHARRRMQQRGIPLAVVEWLLDHGSVQHDHHGGRILYFDKCSRRRLERALGRRRLAGLERFFNAYVVLGPKEILTVGWRYRRIRR